MKDLRILLVEDNPVNQKVALAMLRSEGYEADLARDAKRALQSLEAETYDVAFLDIQMPGMDGLELAKEICRRWPRGDRPKLVALTAYAIPGDREKCLDAGMDDYLSKPVSMDALTATLRDVTPHHAA